MVVLNLQEGTGYLHSDLQYAKFKKHFLLVIKNRLYILSYLIFLCFKHIIIHYQTPKQREIKFKPRTKLNHNIYNKPWWQGHSTLFVLTSCHHVFLCHPQVQPGISDTGLQREGGWQHQAAIPLPVAIRDEKNTLV